MTILFDSVRRVNGSSEFGFGLVTVERSELERVYRKSYTAMDQAWQAGWDAAEEDGWNVVAPASYTVAEAAAFDEGVRSWQAAQVGDWQSQYADEDMELYLREMKLESELRELVLRGIC